MRKSVNMEHANHVSGDFILLLSTSDGVVGFSQFSRKCQRTMSRIWVKSPGKGPGHVKNRVTVDLDADDAPDPDDGTTRIRRLSLVSRHIIYYRLCCFREHFLNCVMFFFYVCLSVSYLYLFIYFIFLYKK